MDFYAFVDPIQMRRERAKAQELRQSSWWKQRLGEGLCYYCGEKFAKAELTMDHVVPISRGGKSTKHNCVVCCKACNSKKGHQLPVEITMTSMAIPTPASISEDVEELDLKHQG